MVTGKFNSGYRPVCSVLVPPDMQVFLLAKEVFLLTKRKELSKKTRFEVFKRDSFTCQYCGRMAPDVILEVDHIKPVAEGGTNDITNLVTSCRDCNRGKGKTLLSDHDAIKKSQAELKVLNEKREQIEMIMQWKHELENFENEQISYVEDLFTAVTGKRFTNHGKTSIKNLIKRYSFGCVYSSTEAALDGYYNDTEESIGIAFSYIPRICASKMLEKQYPNLRDYNYFLKILRNNRIYINKFDFYNFMDHHEYSNDIDFEEIKMCCVNACDFEDFNDYLICLYGEGLK